MSVYPIVTISLVEFGDLLMKYIAIWKLAEKVRNSISLLQICMTIEILSFNNLVMFLHPFNSDKILPLGSYHQ